MQVSRIESKILIDWSKELWFGLLFVCIGWTVWPLMVYFLSRAIEIDYFMQLTLREWAESKVYGPLKDGGFRSISRIAFLFFPWFFSFIVRLALNYSKKNHQTI
jgi:hypothetical protein